MAKFGEWIEVKWRDLTEEEKSYYDEYYGEGEVTKMADFETPDDGDEILISQANGKWVSLVVFCNDDGIGDEYGNDWLDEVDAWMPLPKGFVKNQKGRADAEAMPNELANRLYQQGRRDAIDEFLKKITNISYVADVGTAYQRVVVNLEYAEAIARQLRCEPKNFNDCEQIYLQSAT